MSVLNNIALTALAIGLLIIFFGIVAGIATEDDSAREKISNTVSMCGAVIFALGGLCEVTYVCLSLIISIWS